MWKYKDFFLQLKFYVKLTSVLFEIQKVQFQQAFQIANFDQESKVKALEMVKIAVLAVLKLPKIVFTQNQTTRKFMNFPPTLCCSILFYLI